MTQVLIDRATLEQLVVGLQRMSSACELEGDKHRDGNKWHRLCDDAAKAIGAGRAALANAEPAGWQTLVDHGKEAHELAKIMKDFADKNPESLMLKELK